MLARAADVIAAGILPAGARSIVCGSSAGLLDALQPFDVLSFTGSADTAALIRAHPAVARHSVRANIKADSLNSAILGVDGAPGTAVFDLYVNELVREMTIKSGQRCTAIRRAVVPARYFDAVAEAVGAKLAQISVDNPRNPEVRMGSLVSREQRDHVQAGIAKLATEAAILYDGSKQAVIDADPAVAACLAPTLPGVRDAEQGALVHEHEVFGPVSTLLGYRDTAHAMSLAHRGLGSLMVSVFSDDHAWMPRPAVNWRAHMAVCIWLVPMSAKPRPGMAMSCRRRSMAGPVARAAAKNWEGCAHSGFTIAAQHCRDHRQRCNS